MKKSNKKKSKFPDYHIIYGVNGCEQVLRAQHLQIMNIDLMKDGNAIRKSSLSNALMRFKDRINNLPKDQYLKKYAGLRTQGIVIQFRGEIYKTPNNSKDFLSYAYGDWETVKKTTNKKVYLNERMFRKRSFINKMINKIKVKIGLPGV